MENRSSPAPATGPPGVAECAGAVFDVRGVIHLRRFDSGGPLFQLLWDDLPPRVDAIPSRQRVRQFHLLHGTTGRERDGTAIATLVGNSASTSAHGRIPVPTWKSRAWTWCSVRPRARRGTGNWQSQTADQKRRGDLGSIREPDRRRPRPQRVHAPLTVPAAGEGARAPPSSGGERQPGDAPRRGAVCQLRIGAAPPRQSGDACGLTKDVFRFRSLSRIPGQIR
jgi:hypothetical protein